MVIAKDKWFERKNRSKYLMLDIPWQGIAYFVIMFGGPTILLMLFSPELVIASYYQNSANIYGANIAIIGLAWFIFTFTDIVDSHLKYPLIKLEKENDLQIGLKIERNAGLSVTSTLIIGASISLIYNIYTWNFYLGLFATTAFVMCVVIAITKHKFENRNPNKKKIP